MAKINSKGQLTGNIGPIANRILNGVAIAQSRPGKGKMKQTSGTKQSASEFGIANGISKNIRLALFPILQNHGDTYMHSRFATSVYKATINGNNQAKGNRTLLDGDLELLSDFEFNTNSAYSNYSKTGATFGMNEQKELLISLATSGNTGQINAIEEASHCEIAYLVTVFNPKTYEVTYETIFRYAFPRSIPLLTAQEWKTPVIQPNQLVFITTAIFFIRQNNLVGAISLNNKKLHPCKIVAVLRS